MENSWFKSLDLPFVEVKHLYNLYSDLNMESVQVLLNSSRLCDFEA